MTDQQRIEEIPMDAVEIAKIYCHDSDDPPCSYCIGNVFVVMRAIRKEIEAHQIAQLTPQGDDSGLLPFSQLEEMAQTCANQRSKGERQFGVILEHLDRVRFAQQALTRQEIPETVKAERERVIFLMEEALKELDDHTRVGNFVALIAHLRRQALKKGE